ncbi:MAG: 6,7-dimethyl-8-ribityllumazine synthase [Candidatus Peribacteria bacterium]|nr:MAG: 6,7-dimethyl-8-ribityllumazine synthase [Candidatus Peribacteria bacterium]
MSDYIGGLKDISSIPKGAKIAFVSSEFNRPFVAEQERITKEFLEKRGFQVSNTYSVPGALEIPAMLKRVLEKEHYDLVYCFGVVIRGATTHYEIVSENAARLIMDITLEYSKTAIILGILTCENEEQVQARLTDGFAISGLNLLAEIHAK